MRGRPFNRGGERIGSPSAGQESSPAAAGLGCPPPVTNAGEGDCGEARKSLGHGPAKAGAKRGSAIRLLPHLMLLVLAQQGVTMVEFKGAARALFNATTAVAGFLLTPQIAHAQTQPGLDLAIPRASSPLTLQQGESLGYTVKLKTQPSSSVTVAIESDDVDVTTSTSSLTFTTQNWNERRQ